MRALDMIREIRRRLRREIVLLPICRELQNAERVLAIYEDLVIQKGLADKPLGGDVQAAFDALIDAARRPYAPEVSRPAPGRRSAQR